MSGELNLPPSLLSALDALSILPSNTHVIRNAHGKWVAKSVVEEAKPLLKLGPFGVTKATVFLSFPSKSEAGMYRVDFRTKLSVLEDWVLPTGCHGPISDILLSFEDREKIDILTQHYLKIEATRFCWCYPPAGMDDLSPERKQSLERYVKALDPEFTFLAFGGYVYFKETSEGRLQVLRALALTQTGTGVMFDPPLAWRAEFTPFLFRQGRFQGITIQALKDQGVTYLKKVKPRDLQTRVGQASDQYCYINPNEELLSDSGDMWTPCPNGGFVYLYGKNSEPHALDRFFPQSSSLFSSSEGPSSSSSSPATSPSSSPTRTSPLSVSAGSIPFSMVVRTGPQTPSVVTPTLGGREGEERGRSITFSSSNGYPSTPPPPVVATPEVRNRSNTNTNNNTRTNPNNNSASTNRNPNPNPNPSQTPTPTPPTPTPNQNPNTNSNQTPKPSQTSNPNSSPNSNYHTCVICLEEPVSVIILPCKHICVCSTCGRLLQEKCPLCRGDIRETWNVFL